MGESEVSAAQAPFSKRGSSAPAKLEDAIGAPAMAAAGRSATASRKAIRGERVVFVMVA